MGSLFSAAITDWLPEFSLHFPFLSFVFHYFLILRLKEERVCVAGGLGVAVTTYCGNAYCNDGVLDLHLVTGLVDKEWYN